MATPGFLSEELFMIPAINHPVGHLPHYAAQPDEPVLTRNKRSLDQSHAEGSTLEANNLSANDRRRTTGTLDSLGGGKLL